MLTQDKDIYHPVEDRPNIYTMKGVLYELTGTTVYYIMDKIITGYRPTPAHITLEELKDILIERGSELCEDEEAEIIRRSNPHTTLIFEIKDFKKL